MITVSDNQEGTGRDCFEVFSGKILNTGRDWTVNDDQTGCRDVTGWGSGCTVYLRDWTVNFHWVHFNDGTGGYSAMDLSFSTGRD